TGEHAAVGVERGTWSAAAASAGRRVQHGGLPHRFAGFLVERDEVAAGLPGEDLAVRDGDATVVLRPKGGLVAPDSGAGGSIQREHVAAARGDVHHAVDD